MQPSWHGSWMWCQKLVPPCKRHEKTTIWCCQKTVGICSKLWTHYKSVKELVLVSFKILKHKDSKFWIIGGCLLTRQLNNTTWHYAILAQQIGTKRYLHAQELVSFAVYSYQQINQKVSTMSEKFRSSEWALIIASPENAVWCLKNIV